MRALLFALDGILKKADREPLTAPSHFRVAQRFIVARLGAQTDFIARLSVLEGVASGEGIEPGTWMRLGPNRGMQEASAYFGNLNPKWMTSGSSGLLERAERAVDPILGENSGIPDMSTEDVIQSYLAGLKPFTLRPTTPLFYSVGSDISPHEKEGIWDGSTVPADFFGKTFKYFTNRARDERNSYLAHPARGRAVPMVLPSGESAEEVSHGDIGDAPSEALAEMLNDARDPKAKRIRAILRKINESNTPARREMMTRYFDFIEANPNIRNVDKFGFPRGMATALGKEMGKSVTAVLKQLKEGMAFIIKRAQTNPSLMRMLREMLEMPGEELGYAQTPFQTGRRSSMIHAGTLQAVLPALITAFVKASCGCPGANLMEMDADEDEDGFDVEGIPIGPGVGGRAGDLADAPGEDEMELLADRSFPIGPEGALTMTVGKVGAPRVQRLADRFLETMK